MRILAKVAAVTTLLFAPMFGSAPARAATNHTGLEVKVVDIRESRGSIPSWRDWE